MLACDFFTVDTVLLRRVYSVLRPRGRHPRVHILGVTRHPTGEWVTQQARNFMYSLGKRAAGFRFLVRDRDTKFIASFDSVFVVQVLGCSVARLGLRGARRMRSGGSAPSGESAWTGCSSSTSGNSSTC